MSLTTLLVQYPLLFFAALLLPLQSSLLLTYTVLTRSITDLTWITERTQRWRSLLRVSWPLKTRLHLLSTELMESGSQTTVPDSWTPHQPPSRYSKQTYPYHGLPIPYYRHVAPFTFSSLHVQCRTPLPFVHFFFMSLYNSRLGFET